MKNVERAKGRRQLRVRASAGFALGRARGEFEQRSSERREEAVFVEVFF